MQDLQDLSPILSSEPALRPEDPIYVRGEVQPLWEGQLLGNTWAAAEGCSASVSLGGRLGGVSEAIAWQWPLLRVHLRLLQPAVHPRDGGGC